MLTRTTKFKIIFCLMTLFAVASCNMQQANNTGNKNMENTENKDAIFPKGEKAPAENFTGTVWVKPLAAKDANNNFSIGNVSFEPRARSNWHTHPAGQTLLVIDGSGYVQEKGKPAEKLKKGDVIICSPDVEHWHGAAPDSELTHIAITNYKGDKNVNWLQPVSDAEYEEATKK